MITTTLLMFAQVATTTLPQTYPSAIPPYDLIVATKSLLTMAEQKATTGGWLVAHKGKRQWYTTQDAIANKDLSMALQALTNYPGSARAFVNKALKFTANFSYTILQAP